MSDRIDFSSFRDNAPIITISLSGRDANICVFFILHEFVEKIVIHAATDPHSKINRKQEVDIYYKGIGILEMSKVFDSRQK